MCKKVLRVLILIRRVRNGKKNVAILVYWGGYYFLIFEFAAFKLLRSTAR